MGGSEDHLRRDRGCSKKSSSHGRAPNPALTGAPHHDPAPGSATRPAGVTFTALSSPSGVSERACDGKGPGAHVAPVSLICPWISVPVPQTRSAVTHIPRLVCRDPPDRENSCEEKKSPGVCPDLQGARANGASFVTALPATERQRPEAAWRSCADAGGPSMTRGDAIGSNSWACARAPGKKAPPASITSWP